MADNTNGNGGGLLPAIGAGFGAIANFASGLFSSKANEKINQKNIDFAKEMYDKQKADNIAFWNMQNSYNSPQAQMQRFQAAGLNPNLVYDKGTNGNASSMSAPPAHAPELHPVNKMSGLGDAVNNGIAAYTDLRVRNAQVNNMQLQNDILEQEKTMKALDIAGKAQSISKTASFMAPQLDAIALKNAQVAANIPLTQARTDLTNRQSERTDTLAGNDAVKRYILQNQADIMAATKQDTIRSAALKVLNGMLDASRKRSSIELTQAQTTKTHADTINSSLKPEQIIRATDKLKQETQFSKDENSRRSQMNDRAWIQSISKAVSDALYFGSTIK